LPTCPRRRASTTPPSRRSTSRGRRSWARSSASGRTSRSRRPTPRTLRRSACIWASGHHRARVEAFWEELTGSGYSDAGAPGPRPQYRPDYYGAFVLDPDGNSAEAVHHGDVRTDLGLIDHLWLRTCDAAAARRFYEAIAPVVGIALRKGKPDWMQFRGEHGSFSFVSGDEPTEHVHLAFGVPDDSRVDEFHRVALAAGYRDNGPPGERPEYHAGYYGAYVLDPDGHNVEAVSHNRN
jgi:catechol 2,3-dioxygenase-like lactoylglutathione lyase family enzyme